MHGQWQEKHREPIDWTRGRSLIELMILLVCIIGASLFIFQSPGHLGMMGIFQKALLLVLHAMVVLLQLFYAIIHSL